MVKELYGISLKDRGHILVPVNLRAPGRRYVPTLLFVFLKNDSNILLLTALLFAGELCALIEESLVADSHEHGFIEQGTSAILRVLLRVHQHLTAYSNTVPGYFN